MSPKKLLMILVSGFVVTSFAWAADSEYGNQQAGTDATSAPVRKYALRADGKCAEIAQPENVVEDYYDAIKKCFGVSIGMYRGVADKLAVAYRKEIPALDAANTDKASGGTDELLSSSANGPLPSRSSGLICQLMTTDPAEATYWVRLPRSFSGAPGDICFVHIKNLIYMVGKIQ